MKARRAYCFVTWLILHSGHPAHYIVILPTGISWTTRRLPHFGAANMSRAGSRWYSTLAYHARALQHSYFYTPVTDLIAMVLQQDMPFRSFAETGPYLVFADGYQRFEV